MSNRGAIRTGGLVTQCCPTCGQNMTVSQYFVVQHRGTAWRVPARDVVALESMRLYTRLHVMRPLVDWPDLLVERPIVKILADLPGEYIRVRRNWAVRSTHATAIRSVGDCAVMTVVGVGEVPVGRRYRARVRDAVDLRA